MKKRFLSFFMALVLMMYMMFGMAMAVEVETTTIVGTWSGTKTVADGDTSCVQVDNKAAFDWATITLEPTDTLVGNVEAASTNAAGFIPAINGYTSSWGGWAAVQGEWCEGTSASLTTTVQDVMDVNGVTTISEFGGLIWQVWGSEGDTFDWDFEIQRTGTIDMEVNQTYVQTTEDGSAARFVMLISEELAENSSEVSFNISNGTSSVTRTSTSCYDSISAAGAQLTAPEGYVFVAYAVTGIPSGVSVTCEITVE